jgi:hypothetical protein
VSRTRLLRSWLEDAIDAAPQAKATAEQWLAGFKKDPRVDMSEVRDRGLDTFLTGQRGSVDRSMLQGHLAENPVPWMDEIYRGDDFADYASRGVDNYSARVYGNPAWDNRQGTQEHFPVPGYAYHVRGGDGNRRTVQVIDEIQNDVPLSRNFSPQGVTSWQKWGHLNDAYENSAYQMSQHFAYPPDELLRPLGADTIDDVKGAMNEFADEVAAEGGAGEGDHAIESTLAALDEAQAYLDTPRNMPAADRWKWQAMARELDAAVADHKDALAWTTGDEQYRRYFTRTPEGYLSSGNEQMAEKAAGTERMFTGLYDRDMVKDKRWKQLGLTPRMRRFDGANYWVVDLTPQVREKLAKSGIPYYTVGGAAVLGQQEGAFDGT